MPINLKLKYYKTEQSLLKMKKNSRKKLLDAVNPSEGGRHN